MKTLVVAAALLSVISAAPAQSVASLDRTGVQLHKEQQQLALKVTAWSKLAKEHQLQAKEFRQRQQQLFLQLDQEAELSAQLKPHEDKCSVEIRPLDNVELFNRCLELLDRIQPDRDRRDAIGGQAIATEEWIRPVEKKLRAEAKKLNAEMDVLDEQLAANEAKGIAYLIKRRSLGASSSSKPRWLPINTSDPRWTLEE